MGIVKFKKAFSINKAGSIAKFDDELCEKLVEREICVMASKSDIKSDEDAKKKVEKQVKENIKKAEAHTELMRKLHSPIDVEENKKAIEIVRKKNKYKANKKK